MKRFLVILIFAVAGLSAASISRVQDKGDAALRTMDALLAKYPHPLELGEKLARLQQQWLDARLNYDQSNGTERRAAEKSLVFTYTNILKTSESISLLMEEYSNELLNDVTMKIHQASIDGKPYNKEKYAHSLDVARREISRGIAARRSEQHIYAAHILDRSMDIIKNIYSELEIELPPAFSEDEESVSL